MTTIKRSGGSKYALIAPAKPEIQNLDKRGMTEQELVRHEVAQRQRENIFNNRLMQPPARVVGRPGPRYYKFENGRDIIPCADEAEFYRWRFGEHGLVRVDYTTISNDCFVSTRFLGIDHNYANDGDPLLFETVTSRGGVATVTQRTSTLEDALRTHARAARIARNY